MKNNNVLAKIFQVFTREYLFYFFVSRLTCILQERPKLYPDYIVPTAIYLGRRCVDNQQQWFKITLFFKDFVVLSFRSQNASIRS